MYRANPAFFNASERTLNVPKQVYLKPVLSDSFRLLLGPVAENLISEVTVHDKEINNNDGDGYEKIGR